METSQLIESVMGVMALQEGGGAESATSGALGGTVTGADGSNQPTGQGGQGQSGGGFPMLFLFLLPVMLLLIFSSMMGGRKEKKKRAEMMASLKKHDKVQTIGGVIGTVVELGQDDVVLRVDETSKTRIRFSRSAIQQVLRGGSGGGEAGGGEQQAAELSANGVVEKATA